MTHLHEVLATQRVQVMQRWLEAVRGTLHPESMPRVELVDHLPAFLDYVVARLTRAADDADGIEIAEEHGSQRLALGFSLDSVVREYGALRSAMLSIAAAEGVTVTTRDLEVIIDCTINAIASAVSEYSRQRDAEMQRQATEHFAFIAHELRNPLSTSRLALSVLQTRNLLDGSDHTAQVLDRGLKTMEDLIDHTLRTARFGSRIELNPEPIQLRTLLEETESAVAVNAQSKDIRLELAVESDHEMVIDVRLVRSALSNLVRNAIKFTHQSGTVTVRGKVIAGRATIEIEDACGGLPPGDLEKMFSPFVQLGSDPNNGFGLGLAIARQAVDAHGGSIRVQNVPERGCIFVLELPTSPPTVS